MLNTRTVLFFFQVKGQSSFPVLSTRVEGYPDQISHKRSEIALSDSTNERKEEDHENEGWSPQIPCIVSSSKYEHPEQLQEEAVV